MYMRVCFMTNKIRILQVVSIMNVGGIETMLMNYLRNIDRNLFEVDFLVHREDEGFFDKEIKTLGAQIYKAPSINPFKKGEYKSFMKEFFNNHHYDIVHSHLDALSYFPLMCAKNANIDVRVAHSHVNGFDKDAKYLLRRYYTTKIPKVATDYAACSESAGKFMFPNAENVKVILNPLDIEKFKYSEQSSHDLKQEFSLPENSKVVGHVGRFNKAKNHPFIVELAKLNPELIFVCVGEGDDKPVIEKLCLDQEVDNIVFTGVRSDVYRFYSLFDIFILPSFYEGLGNVAIEAQCAGIPTIVSEHVSSDVDLTNLVDRFPLNLDMWSSAIQKHISDSKELMIPQSLMKYDIKPALEDLESFYCKLVGGKDK